MYLANRMWPGICATSDFASNDSDGLRFSFQMSVDTKSKGAVVAFIESYTAGMDNSGLQGHSEGTYYSCVGRSMASQQST